MSKVHAYTQIDNFADRQKDRERKRAFAFYFYDDEIFSCVAIIYNVFGELLERRREGGRERINKLERGRERENSVIFHNIIYI